MGDRVEIGSLIYNVFDTKWMPQLGEGTSARVPEHRYFLVRLSILNSGAKPVTVPLLQLVDSRGQIHSELSDGKDVPQWVGFLREAQPADSVQGNVVFDVAPGHYKLRLTDESEQRVALIDIPLQFQNEAIVDPPADSQPKPPAR
jgi:hypothetical protein